MKNAGKRAAVIIVCLVAVIAIVSGSLAWYTSNNSSTQVGSVLGFRTTAKVYFQNSDGKKFNASPSENGLYKLSLDPSDSNYIGNFRVNVIHKGYAKSYVRVKLSVQWTMPDGKIAQNVTVPFKFDEKWYDNRENDYSVYYTETSGLFGSYDKSIITGLDAEKFETTTLADSATPYIYVSAESVQANRYQQIWGIQALPWE